MAVCRFKRAVGDGPQRQRACPMCTYVPRVVGDPTDGGAQEGGKALQLAVRRRPRSHAERDRPRRSRTRRIPPGRLVRQRLDTRGGVCVGEPWAQPRIPLPAPARRPDLLRANACLPGFRLSRPPVRYSIANPRLFCSTTSRRPSDENRGQRTEAMGQQNRGRNK